MILLTESRDPNFAYTLSKRNAYLRVAVLALAMQNTMQQTQANLLYSEVFKNLPHMKFFSYLCKMSEGARPCEKV